MGTKQMDGWASPRGLAALLALAVASASPTALARMGPVPSAASRAIKGVTLEVEIAPNIVESADLRRWIDEDGRRVLEALPDDPDRRGGLSIEVTGALYEYHVSITASRDRAVVGTPSTWTCDCSNGELLDRLRTELSAVAEGLAAKVEEEPEVTPLPEPEPEPTKVDPVDEPRRGLGPAGAAGVTLMVLGAAGAGAGIGLMVAGDRDVHAAEGSIGSRHLVDPGRSIIGVGGGVLLTGLVLVLLRKRIDRPSHERVQAIAPVIDGGGVRLSVVGRF